MNKSKENDTEKISGGADKQDAALQSITTFEDKQKLMRDLESRGEFNAHLTPPDWSGAKPFGSEFPYIPRGIKKLKYALMNFFVVRPFRRHKAKSLYKIKVSGLENLKDLGGAIAICNHIEVFDCMALSFALKHRRVKFIAAEFNNKKGWFGEAMRAHGMLPLSAKFPVLKKFNAAIRHYLDSGDIIFIYPEEAMWDYYPKPRPFKNGAFFYAAKFAVPVLPTFITLRDAPSASSKNAGKKHFTINFAPPIYPNPGLSTEQNTNLLRDKAYAACVEIYEKFYNKKLIFDSELPSNT